MKKAAVFPSNQKEFQLELLELQIAQENKISHENIVFLDRTIPDALAYYRFMNLPEDKELLEALSKVCYKKVFILDCLTLVQDYARTEDEAAQKKIDALISEVMNHFLSL